MSSETKKRRPTALNLSNANPLPGTLQTPKNIAQDIAKHCLSPTVPRGISHEMLLRAQEIEHQQRQLILQRGLSAYDQRMEDEQEPKSQGSTPTSNLSVDSTSSAPAAGASDSSAIPPNRVPRSVPGSATSLTYGRRPWELSNVPHEAPHSAVPSLNSSTTPTDPDRSVGDSSETLQERRGARSVSLDVKALKRDSVAAGSDGGADPESRAIDDDDDNILPSIHKLAGSVHPAKKQRFMQLCEEMWDLLHS